MHNTSILGISMVKRSRRRVFVTVVYLLLSALIALVIWIRHDLFSGSFLSTFNLLFIILFTGISRALFGQMCRQDTFPAAAVGDNKTVSWRYNTIFGSYRDPNAVEDADERQLAVRNRAYFKAFQSIAIYTALLWLVIAVISRFRSAIPLDLMALSVFPLLVMAVTLPQAWVLWTEPDLPIADEELAPARI